MILKNKIKVYFIEVVSESQVNMMSVDINDRHKIWLSHPNAKEISGKEYFKLKDYYNANKIESATADALGDQSRISEEV